MRKLYFLLILFITPWITQAQTRYLDEVFTDVNVESNVLYGVNATVLYYSLFNEAVPEALRMDIYKPEGDTETDRPLVLYFHTGNFLPFRNPADPTILGANGSCGGERSDSAAVEIATRLTRMGYVVAVVSYRLGWNPLASTDVLRRYGIINAAYRGIQDARTAIRYFRKTVDEFGNPHGIDQDKIIVWGQGTGGYLALTMGSLDNYLKIPLASEGKFIWDHDGDPGTPPIPMVLEFLNGDIYGTSVGINPTDGDTLCYPNHLGYSSDYALGVNTGGAHADSAWVAPGQTPLISFAVPNDNFAPYGEGIVNVPGTDLQVIKAQGSYIINGLNEQYGNQTAFADAGIDFAYSAEQAAAYANSPTDFGNPPQDFTTPVKGLYPFVVADDPNFPGIPWTVAPWEWTSYVPTNPAQKCNNDGAIARAYIDTIVGFYAPRACFVLNLADCIEQVTGINVVQPAAVGLTVFPNPASDVIYFKSANDQPIRELTLYDEMGRLHRALPGNGSHTMQLERGALSVGRYIAMVRFDEGTVIQKVVFN